MAVFEAEIQTSEYPGAVDLTALALPPEDPAHALRMQLETQSGLKYMLDPAGTTELLPNGVIAPVNLSFGETHFTTGTLRAELGVGIRYIRNLITERRHFPLRGGVEVAGALVRHGDRLEINGHQTGPLKSAWVYQRLGRDATKMVWVKGFGPNP